MRLFGHIDSKIVHFSVIHHVRLGYVERGGSDSHKKTEIQTADISYKRDGCDDNCDANMNGMV